MACFKFDEDIRNFGVVISEIRHGKNIIFGFYVRLFKDLSPVHKICISEHNLKWLTNYDYYDYESLWLITIVTTKLRSQNRGNGFWWNLVAIRTWIDIKPLNK